MYCATWNFYERNNLNWTSREFNVTQIHLSILARGVEHEILSYWKTIDRSHIKTRSNNFVDIGSYKASYGLNLPSSSGSSVKISFPSTIQPFFAFSTSR